MFMEYWVDLGINIWKNERKTHILCIFQLPIPVHLEPVPVQVLQNRTCTGTGQTCTGTPCSILISVRN